MSQIKESRRAASQYFDKQTKFIKEQKEQIDRLKDEAEREEEEARRLEEEVRKLEEGTTSPPHRLPLFAHGHSAD